MSAAHRPPWLEAWRLHLLRGDTQDAAHLPRPDEAQAWIEGLAAEGMLAAAARAHLAGLPRPFHEALAASAREQTAWRMLAQANLQRVLGALARVEVVPLVLKGLPLAQRLFGDPHARDAGDLDLLVAPEDLVRAAGALRALGLVPDQLEVPSNRLERTLGPGALTFRGPPGVDVDLHWSLGERGFSVTLDPSHVLRRAQSVDVGGLPVRILADEDQLVYLAGHGGRHGWSRACWIRDIAVLVTVASAMDGRTVTLRARSAGLLRHVGLALALARRDAHAVLPPWATRLADVPEVERLLLDLASLPPATSGLPLRHHLRRLAWRRLARERASDRTRDALHFGLDALRWRGDKPVGLATALLYMPVRLVSVVARRLRRR